MLPPGDFVDGCGLSRGRGRPTEYGGTALRLEQSVQLVERADWRSIFSLAYFGCDQSQVQRYLTGKIDRAKPLKFDF